MPLHIRRADLDSDEPAITGLLRRHLAPTADAFRFRWLYREGVHGQAQAWLACDSGGRAVGLAVAFPRRMLVHGVERRNWVLGDFCLDEEFRSLGPALRLQRACFELLREPAAGFCYDFPSAAMMAVYKRIGTQFEGSFERWVLPLKSQRRLEGVVRSKTLARLLSPLADLALAWRGRKGNRTCQITVHTGPCGAEFDALEEGLRTDVGIHTMRSAEYLNWRYLASWGGAHEILTARLTGRLAGYVVVRKHTGEEASIVDLSCKDDPALVAALLAGAAVHCKQRGGASVNLSAGGNHPWQKVFQQCGFVRREASPLIVYGAPQMVNEALRAPLKWYLMQGERDC
jgi:hypothetical protein